MQPEDANSEKSGTLVAGRVVGKSGFEDFGDTSTYMTSERLRRIIRSRWWVLAVAGFLSVLTAVPVTQSRNAAIPEYEVVAAITYNRLLGEIDDAPAQERLNTAEAIALDVNASELATGVDPLLPGARAEVIGKESDLRLLFIGRGATPEEASSVATTMRDRYLAVQQLDISQEFAQRIADTAARLDQVLAAIAVAAAPPDVDDIETTVRRRELQAEVDAFASLYAQYTAELIAQATATDLVDGDVYTDAGAEAGSDVWPEEEHIINNGADIIETVATADVTAGQIDWYCQWRPLEDGASVIPA